MTDSPLISIVTPVYKGSDFIEQLIQSVLEQTYPNIEHIIIDDGSPDDGKTVEILKKYPHLKWWTRENKGQFASVNEGFRVAKGEWVTTISHDDLYMDKNTIQAVVDFLKVHPNVDVVHGLTRMIDVQGNPLPIQIRQKYPYWVLQYNLFMAHCSMFMRLSALKKSDVFFDESFRFAGDADWIMRLQLAGLKFEYMDRIIADYRIHPNQGTSRSFKVDSAIAIRNAEVARVANTYGKSKALRLLVSKWVTFDRRKRVLLAMLRGHKRETLTWYG